jgi:SAM-dependent methyltransferase
VTEAAYDRIGRGYTEGRQPDPRIAEALWQALGEVTTVLNVGAGTGNYEPPDRLVVAVEPSFQMIRQRSSFAAPVARGVAEALPFANATFDAATAILTLHHWQDLDRGLAELRRVSGRQVIFMFDPPSSNALWLIDDYFPEILALPTERDAPSVSLVAEHLNVVSVQPVPVPADCVDGFAGCYWNRPEAYLRPEVRMAMSCFATMDPAVEARGADLLRADLESGRWDERHGHLRVMNEFDLGYRLVIAGA